MGHQDIRETIKKDTGENGPDPSRRNFLIGTAALGAGLAGVPGMVRAAPGGRAGGAGSHDYDVVIVGSGINSLVAAALLAKEGQKVCVLERNDRPGGCIRTEELTLPGFRHDVLSSFYPLFVTSPAYAALKQGLQRHGLAFANTKTPTAVLLPDNRSLILKRSRAENVRAMDAVHKGDGRAYDRGLNELLKNADLTFGLLGKEPWSFDTLRMILSAWWDLGLHGLTSYFGTALRTCRGWLEGRFGSDLCRALLAPWVLHTGLGPENALSGFMDRLIFVTLEQAGMPVVKGGSERIVRAFVKFIEEHNGVFVVNADAAGIITRGNRAVGVRTTEGVTYRAGKAVICNVTPAQLYQRLLDPRTVPPRVLRQAAGYRYGRGDMQIHMALDEPPEWPDPGLKNVAMVHVTPGLDGLSGAVNEAERGLLPAQATIVVGQPTAMDPSRAPKGKWILWLQLQELPRNGHLLGDAKGEIVTPADGRWDPETAERYADRIIGRLSAQIPNLRRSLLARKVLSPADLEARNMNLVGGDPYSGACSVDQFFLWRPLRATRNHTTPVKDLYHIGAATHPGPGLGGMSGYLVAGELTG